MRVAILNTLYKCGGAETAVRLLFEGLRKKGIKVKFFHRQKIDRKIKGIVRIPNIELDNYFKKLKETNLLRQLSKNIFVPSSLTVLSKLIDDFNPDIIHLHNLHDAHAESSISYSVLPKLSKKYPIVWTLHSGHPVCDCHWFFCEKYKHNCQNCKFKKNPYFQNTFVYRTIKKQFYETSDFSLITPSLWLKKQIFKTELKRFQIYHIPNAVNMNLFRPITNAREKLNLPFNKKIILFAAAYLKKHKGIKYLFEALKKIDLENVYILAIGKPSLKCDLSINFVGYIEHEKMPLYYSAADIFVNPSLAETAGLTNLEAMACETPVISTNCTAIPEYVANKKTGLLVPPANVNELAKAINYLLKKDKLRIEMGKRGKEKVKKEFNIEVYINRHIQLYKKLINHPRNQFKSA